MSTSGSAGMMELHAPGCARIAAMALEELKRRSEGSQRGEIPRSEAAAVLGCGEEQVVDKIDALVASTPDLWNWIILHGEGFVAVGRRFTRRDAARIKKLMKLPEYRQIAQLPTPPAMFGLGEAARILQLPRRKTALLLGRWRRKDCLQWFTLAPPGGQKGLRWQRKW
jgi:hypothetical protein